MKFLLLRSPLLAIVPLTSLIPLIPLIPPAQALPPPDDPPEEVLRTEIITEARSPLDGEPLTAAEYAELEAALQNPDFAPQLSSEVRQIIFLLQIRRALRGIAPFLVP